MVCFIITVFLGPSVCLTHNRIQINICIEETEYIGEISAYTSEKKGESEVH